MLSQQGAEEPGFQRKGKFRKMIPTSAPLASENPSRAPSAGSGLEGQKQLFVPKKRFRGQRGGTAQDLCRTV